MNLQSIDWKALLLTFDGRIDRKHFWIGMAVAVAISLVGTVLGAIVPVVGYLIALAFNLASAVPAVAVGMKRLHDLDKDWRWLLVFYAAPTALLFLGVLLSGALGIQVLATVAPLAALALVVWCIYELGVQKGTAGANRYGPPPGEAALKPA